MTTKGGFEAGDYTPDFKMQHPKVYAEIAADFDTWAPPTIVRHVAD